MTHKFWQKRRRMIASHSKTVRCVGTALAVITMLVTAAEAQPETEDITIDVNVNYRLAYRDDSWAPVDVLIVNNLFDVSGHVEVRTYSNNRLQSPIYRVPAQSPKASVKRFRLHCRLNQTSRIEAMLYHRGRPVRDVPAWLDIRPIDPQDLLALVLDDEPMNYGFLNMALDTDKEDMRLYREEVYGDALGLLADYPQCYEPYDVIIMGDIYPDRISVRHRNLIRHYVREGGMLVVCTGENAQNYRGSWVEAFCGIAVGETSIIDGPQLAARAFDKPERDRARSTRAGAVADLTPMDPAIRVRGNNVVLAAMRPVGRGAVVTLAVDAASRLLQDTPGYHRLWRELCRRRRDEADLNYQAATNLYVQRLPYVTGIELFSKSSVMLYLFLYFGVAIVGNGIVCSVLKRRELAWFFLVLFSIGFTAYAMVYGTAGRAKANKLDQLEVVRATPGGGPSQVRSIVSLISARSSQQSIDFKQPFSLAADVKAVDPRRMQGRYFEAKPSQPFYLVQGTDPRIEGLRIGASELRLIEVQTEVDLPGGIEGVLTLDERGLHGTLKNSTGFELYAPFVLYDGRSYPARVTPNGIVLEAVQPREDRSQRGGYGGSRWYPAQRGRGGSLDSRQRTLYNEFLNELISASSFGFMPGRGINEQLHNEIGPFLIAWKQDGPVGTVRPEDEVQDKGGAALFVADVPVQVGEQAYAWREVPVRIGGGDFKIFPKPSNYMWLPNAFSIVASNVTLDADILIPRDVRDQETKQASLQLYWAGSFGGWVRFTPKGLGDDWYSKHFRDTQSEQTAMHEQAVLRERYDFDDWRDYCDPDTGILAGELHIGGAPRGAQAEPVFLSLSAQVQVPQSRLEDVRGATTAVRWHELPVRAGDGAFTILPSPHIDPRGWQANAVKIAGRSGNHVAALDIRIPPALRDQAAQEIIVELYSELHGGFVTFKPKGASTNWSGEHMLDSSMDESSQRFGVLATRTVFRFDDWRSYYEPASGLIPCEIYADTMNDAHAPPVHASVTARMLVPNMASGNEEWKPWPLSKPSN